jgi:hypothetical protein
MPISAPRIKPPATAAPGPTAGVDLRRLRSVRWTARLPRLAFVVASAALAAAGLHSIFARTPPRPAAERHVVAPDDPAAEALAEAFARTYLSWDSRDPAAHEAALAAFMPRSLETGSGVQLPSSGHQAVRWTAVTNDVPTARGALVTVAADTTNGPVHLAIQVLRRPHGRLALAGYPAVVGTLPVDRDVELTSEDPVDDAQLESTTQRALANYLGGRRDVLAADLSPGALAAVPDQPLRLLAIDETTWSRPGGQIAVITRVQGKTGIELTLRYLLDVVHRAGRWFVQSIESNQPTNEVHR